MPKILSDIRTEIYRKAKELFKGDAKAFTMRALAESCDIALGTIYNYYPSKVDIVIEMIAEQWSKFVKGAESIQGADFFDDLRQLYDQLYTHFRSYDRHLLKTLTNLSGKEKKRSQEVEEMFLLRVKELVEGFMKGDSMVMGRDAVRTFGVEKLSAFIFNNFKIMIKNNTSDFAMFDYVLRSMFSVRVSLKS